MCKTLTHASEPGLPLVLAVLIAEFFLQDFRFLGARRIWIGINTISAIHSLGNCKRRINAGITAVSNT